MQQVENAVNNSTPPNMQPRDVETFRVNRILLGGTPTRANCPEEEDRPKHAVLRYKSYVENNELPVGMEVSLVTLLELSTVITIDYLLLFDTWRDEN